MSERRFVIIAPFWGDPRHVGCFRVERFRQWLEDKNIPVTIIRAGNDDRFEETAWGLELTIKDPLKIHGDIQDDGAYEKASSRRPNKLRRWVAEWFFNPDLSVVWARRVANHPLVQEFSQEATDFLASGAPDAVHIPAAILARRYKARHIVDMRDGWLDEPLKPLLIRSPLRRRIEGRLESRLLKQADRVFVTSEVWGELLSNRLPFTTPKIRVLTNAYPVTPPAQNPAPCKRPATRMLRLVHAGKFTGSRSTQLPRHVFEPLIRGLNQTHAKGEILLLGRLERQDKEEIVTFEKQLQAAGWSIRFQDRVPREAALDIMDHADGLLLLCASDAALPTKLFDYVTTCKPILAATPENSAVWRAGKTIPQMFNVDFNKPDQGTAAAHFIQACLNQTQETEVPPDYSEAFLANIFYDALDLN